MIETVGNAFTLSFYISVLFPFSNFYRSINLIVSPCRNLNFTNALRTRS